MKREEFTAFCEGAAALLKGEKTPPRNAVEECVKDCGHKRIVQAIAHLID